LLSRLKINVPVGVVINLDVIVLLVLLFIVWHQLALNLLTAVIPIVNLTVAGRHPVLM